MIVEQPVDAIAGAQTVLERFDVDVRGLDGQRAIDEQIDQTDHRGLEGQVAEVIDILTLVTLTVCPRRSHPLDNLLERGVGPVGPLDGLQDRLSRRHAELNSAAQRLAQIIAKHRIGGFGGGHRHGGPIHSDRAGHVLPEILGGQQFHNRWHQRQLFTRTERQAMLGSQCPEDFVRRCRPHCHQRLSEPLPPFRRVNQRLGERLLADNPPLDEKPS